MFSTIIRVCCDGGMGNTHIGSRKKDWIVERECKGYLRRGRDKSSVTTKIVALQPQGWEVVNNNYPKGYFQGPDYTKLVSLVDLPFPVLLFCQHLLTKLV